MNNLQKLKKEISMKPQNNLSKLRKVIISEIPELKEKVYLDIKERKWEKEFYESEWGVGTIKILDNEKEFMEDMGTFMPRHMPVYDWNLPYNEFILLKIRRYFLQYKITLADVLRVVWIVQPTMKITDKDRIDFGAMVNVTEERVFEVVQDWNLSKNNLDLQSKGTIDFLTNLICKDE